MVDEQASQPAEPIDNTEDYKIPVERRRIMDLVAARAEQLAKAEKSPPAEAAGSMPSEAQMAENVRQWDEQHRKTHPESYDENGNFLTWEEREARRKAAARLAELSQPEILPPRGATLAIPQGSIADLLEHQVGVCAGLIGNIAEYVAGNEARPEVCFPFMDRIARLVSSSAKAGRTIGHLRGIAAETRQTFVRQKEGKREGVTT
jgi:hypothetical protein